MAKKIDYKKRHETYKKRKQTEERNLMNTISDQSDVIWKLEKKLKDKKIKNKGKYFVKINAQTRSNITC